MSQTTIPASGDQEADFAAGNIKFASTRAGSSWTARGSVGFKRSTDTIGLSVCFGRAPSSRGRESLQGWDFVDGAADDGHLFVGPIALDTHSSLWKAFIAPRLRLARSFVIRSPGARRVLAQRRSVLTPRDALLRTSPLAFCLPTKRGSSDKKKD